MGQSQSKTFWSFLILVDVLLLTAFGWALADRLYTILEEPVTSIEPARLPKARTVHPVDQTNKGPAGPPAPAPATETKKKEEPVHARKAAPARAKKEAPKPAQPASTKARKVVFSYRNWSAKKVLIEGTLTKWKSQPMQKGKGGEWTFTTYLLPGADYPYRFVVDGKMIADPENPNQKWGKSLRPVK